MRVEFKAQSVIYNHSQLTDFQKKVNSAAAELALQYPSLVNIGNGGVLFDKACQQVSSEGCIFQKGKSRSKLYGSCLANPM